MKKILILLFLSVIVFFASAQTQQGYVKTRGRMNAAGTVTAGARLSGATLNVRNASSIISGNKGTFSFVVPSNTFCITGVQKQGYVLCDNDILNKMYRYSVNPFIVVMDTPENNTADRLAAEKKIRRSLQRQLQDKEDEIETLKAQQKITEAEYNRQLQELYAQHSENEKLIAEMANRYSTIDFDQLDEFQRQVAFFIQNGELTRADSLLNTKGSMADRSAELDRMDAAIKADAEELAKRQKAHEEGVAMKAKVLADFAADCYSRHEICKLQHKNDSAAYWLELRASKDTTRIDWLIGCGYFISDYLADYESAEKYMQMAVNLSASDTAGYSNDLRSSTLADLAHVYLKCGRHEESINLYQKAIELCGDNSEIYCFYLTALANCYETIQEVPKALAVLREAHAKYLQDELNDHHVLYRIYNQLGIILCENGEYEESLRYFNLALEIAENDDIVSVPRKATLYLEVASLYRHLDMYDKSADYFNKALEISKMVFGEKHPLLSTIYNDLGILYSSQSRLKEALEYLMMALEADSERKFTDNYAQVCSNIASVYLKMGDFLMSEQYELEALDIRLKLFDENSLAMVNEYNSLGALYCEKGDYEKAQHYIEKAVFIRKRDSGELHPSLMSSYSYLAGINLRRGQIEEALKYFLCDLEICLHFYGETHTSTASTYTNVGGMYMYLKKYDEAIAMIKKALEIHLSIYGEKHAEVAVDYNGLGQTYMAMESYQEAIACFTKAIEIRQEVFGNDSVKLKPLYEFMIKIYTELGNQEKIQWYSHLLEELS